MLLALELEESTGGETGRENVPFIWAIETGIHKQPDWFRCVFLFPDVL